MKYWRLIGPELAISRVNIAASVSGLPSSFMRAPLSCGSRHSLAQRRTDQRAGHEEQPDHDHRHAQPLAHREAGAQGEVLELLVRLAEVLDDEPGHPIA